MPEETYQKFKKNILSKMKKMQSNFQEPVVEYCEPEQVIDICSYNHYPVIDKTNKEQGQHNDDNDIYDTSELKHEFEYGIYEDVFKTEQLMADLKCIDEAELESKKLGDLEFKDFPLEQFSDAEKVANEGDPHLKAAADTELYNLEKRAIQTDIDKHNGKYTSDDSDDEYTSSNADETQMKTQLVMCNNMKMSMVKTIVKMTKTNCERQYTDQHMSHTLKMARNFCCHKLQICLVKTILNYYVTHYPRVCATLSMKV